MTITIEEFARTVEPNTRVFLYTKTALAMNKKDVATKTIPNPFTEVFKVSCIEVTLNANYEARMNEQLIKEGKAPEFKAQELPYGKMVGNALLENKEQLYLKCIEERRVGKSTYVDAQDNVIQYEDLKPFIPVSKPSATAVVENAIQVRNFKLSSISGFEVM